MKLSFRVKKSIEDTYAYLSDMQKFVLVHPIIFRIDPLGGERYWVHETLKVGCIPFTFRYPVQIERSDAERVVIIRARVFGLTRIEMTFRLSRDGLYTVIDEEVLFTTPLPVHFILERTFKQQHSILFKNIELS
jgi:carbon monoxide dehydrogenase subunit G